MYNVHTVYSSLFYFVSLEKSYQKRLRGSSKLKKINGGAGPSRLKPNDSAPALSVSSSLGVHCTVYAAQYLC